MRSCLFFLCAIAVLFLAAPLTAEQTSRLDRGEIIVTTKDIAGSDIPSVQVTGVINVPPAEVWAIISNCDRYEGRMPRINAARQIRREGSTFVCEVTVDLPFPLSDLTSTTSAEHTVGPPTWKREWTMIEGDYERNDGSWVLTAFDGDDQRTLAIYTVHAEPRSKIPSGIRRRAQQSSMPGIIERLRELTSE